MRFKAICILCLVLGVAVVTLPAGIAYAESLDETVRSAVSNHPSIAAALARRDYAQEEAEEQYSGFLPQVSLNSSTGRIYGDNATSRGFTTTRGAGYSYLWEGGVTARQKIFDGFETDSRVDSALALEESAGFDLRDTQEKLAYSAVQAYIDLMRAHRGLQMLTEHRALVDDYTERLAAMIEQGGADEAQLQQARDIQVILEGLILDYQGQARTAESNYHEVTGRPPEGPLALPAPRLDMIPQNMDEALALARQNNPGIQAAAQKVVSAASDIDAEKAGLFPALDSELSYQKIDKRDIIGGEAVDARAMLRMNWNFELGGGQLDRIAKRKKGYIEAQAQQQELEREIERAVRLAYAEADTARQQKEVKEKRRALNEKLLETNKIQFDGGKLNLLQLMQSSNQYFTTRLELMNTAYRDLAAQYGILSSTGRLLESLDLSQEPAQAAALVSEPAVHAPLPAPDIIDIESDVPADAALTTP